MDNSWSLLFPGAELRDETEGPALRRKYFMDAAGTAASVCLPRLQDAWRKRWI
jgi:hypothetical protein